MSEKVPLPAPDPAARPQRFGEGSRWEGDSPEDIASAVEAAFDYRGDVSIRLDTGVEVTGYVSNRNGSAPDPFLDLLPSDGSPSRRLLYRSVRAIAFSGKDAASDKSWEAWVRKYEAKKKAEARGEKGEGVGLFPEPLD